MFLKINIEKGCFICSQGVKRTLTEDSAVLFNIESEGKVNAIIPDFSTNGYKLYIGDYCSFTADNNEILTNYIDEIARAMGNNAPVCAITVYEGNTVYIFDIC